MARIVFDLDGTLIDSAPDIHRIANAVLEREGCDPITLEQTREFVGNGSSVFVARMRAARGIADSEQDRLLADFMARYDDAVTLTEPYPGVVSALRRLSGEHALGLCTNKPLRPCRAVLRHLGLEAFFGTVIGGDSLSVNKPDPAPLLAAFDGLGDGPCLYVGDSEVDAETAERARVTFLLFTEGYRSTAADELPHDGAFARFEDLPALVGRVVAGS